MRRRSSPRLRSSSERYGCSDRARREERDERCLHVCVRGAPPSPEGREVAPVTAPQALRQVGRYGVLLALVALILFGWLRYDNFLGAFNILSVLRYNSMFALIALGMCFVIMTGGIDLSVGSVAAMASVVSALLSPYGLAPALLGAVLVATFVGVINGVLIAYLDI